LVSDLNVPDKVTPIRTNFIPGLTKVLEFLRNFKNQKGAAAVEYGVMVALIAAVIVGAVTTIGQKLLGAFNVVVNALAAIK
jgi:pilus assembly protein Flp/PilA